MICGRAVVVALASHWMPCDSHRRSQSAQVSSQGFNPFREALGTALGRMPVTSPPQFRHEMEASWRVVDDLYDTADIFGKAAEKLLLPMSARAAHHDLPLALSLVSGLIACSNGARVEACASRKTLWPRGYAFQN